MQAPRKYDQEIRDRAVWMYRERRQAHPAESANESRRQIGGLIDVNPEALRAATRSAPRRPLTEPPLPTRSAGRNNRQD
jgi:hypothetical protein